jgi:hypothetical protein
LNDHLDLASVWHLYAVVHDPFVLAAVEERRMTVLALCVRKVVYSVHPKRPMDHLLHAARITRVGWFMVPIAVTRRG